MLSFGQGKGIHFGGSRESERLKKAIWWRPQKLKGLSLADHQASKKGHGNYPSQIFHLACFASDLHVIAEEFKLT